VAPGDITPQLLAAARGDAPADLVLANARVINVFTREIAAGDVAILGDRIAAVIPVGSGGPAGRTIDLKGSYLAPGFIDAHMHIESSMLPPSEFASLAVPHGTTGVIADPHEIANVLGLPGIRWMMDNASGLPIDIRWTASSCVPSCHLETSGARLDADDLAPLFEDPRVIALAEMMNFPGAVHADPGVLRKINLGLAKRLVDGHAPGLSGRSLQAYAAAGVSSDHECTTRAEAEEKLRAGMMVYIREGSAARNLEALLPIVNERTLHRVCFCTDDRHPGDLHEEGHIDHVVRRAIALGLDPVMAIVMGTFNVARHYGIRDAGAVAPGRIANLIVFDDLRAPRPRMVFHRGVQAACDGAYLGKRPPLDGFSAATVRLPATLAEPSFRIAARASRVRIRAIGMDPHQLVTEHLIVDGHVQDGALVADPARDLLKLVVIERHRGSGNIGRGFVHGFRLSRGALASTVGHDAHNLAVVGTNDRDMLAAARALEQSGGGQCVAEGGRMLALLPLPIAGLMSDQPAAKVIEQQRAVLAAARSLGCPHPDPFMPLSFMPLPVIPKLKLSDLGLVDVEKFEIVPLEAE